MSFSSEIQSKIEAAAAAHRLPSELVYAVVEVESGGDPLARSPVGARGLMQLMPATFIEMGGVEGEIYDPAANLDAGCKYLRLQFDKFAEIKDPHERMKIALAAYNGGRGYINRALKLTRKYLSREDARVWSLARLTLAYEECEVGGRRPDWRQIWDYVERVWRRYVERLYGV